MLYTTVGAMPLYVVRWKYGPLPTTLLETLIIVTVALYVIARWREGMRRPTRTWLEIPIVLLLVPAAISVEAASYHKGPLRLYPPSFVEPIAIFSVPLDLLN